MKLSTSGRSGRRTGNVPGISLRHGGKTRFRHSLLLFTAVVAVASVVVIGNFPSAAYATDYPSWPDVQAAKGNVDKTNAQITRIQNIISGLGAEVVGAQALAEQRGSEYQEAQQAFDAADRRAAEIERQAEESAASAEAAVQQAGRLAAQLYRSGGNDLSVNLLFEGNGEDADQLLSKLGSMSKMVERSSTVYEQAQMAKNTAQSLGDQAEVARGEREKLRVAAQTKLEEAMAAQQAAESALAEQQERGIELDQQLKALQDVETKTVAGYKEGVAERERIRKAEEQAAREKAEAERIAAEKAAAENSGSGSGNSGSGSGGQGSGGQGSGGQGSGGQGSGGQGSGGQGSGGQGSGGQGSGGEQGNRGWARPAGGYISDGYGPRATICDPSGNQCSQGFHAGTDLAAGCGAGIYAANSGTVTYAGWLGTYGNFILIDHGNGVSTGYAHIVDGGIAVNYGERVSSGERIARVGHTGAADGCHLHFEVRLNGSAVNAVPYMAARGIYL